MLKYIVAIIALLFGLILALSPIIFNTEGVHADRILHAQWAGFFLLAAGVFMGVMGIITSRKSKSE